MLSKRRSSSLRCVAIWWLWTEGCSQATWVFYLARAVNADRPCVASKYGQISKRGNLGACRLPGSSDTRTMTPFGKTHFAWETSDYFSLLLRTGASFFTCCKKTPYAFLNESLQKWWYCKSSSYWPNFSVFIISRAGHFVQHEYAKLL